MRAIGWLALSISILFPRENHAQLAPDSAADQAAKMTQVMDESYALLNRGLVGLAEARLEALNALPPKTTEWHLQNATNLLRVAFTAKERGDQATAERAAKLARGQINQAGKLAGDDHAFLTRITGLRTVISERFLSNSTEAAKERANADRKKDKSENPLNSK
jgi:hypothetical protein